MGGLIHHDAAEVAGRMAKSDYYCIRNKNGERGVWNDVSSPLTVDEAHKEAGS